MNTQPDTEQLLAQRIRQLRRLSWQEAARLPDRVTTTVAIGASECTLTTFRQAGVLPLADAVLVTVQLARPRCFGALGDVVEKGLVFAPGQAARAATPAELMEAGE
jgi:hypothetical protein